uniref:Nucleotide-diphospho-sugar transferase domain-containing protein n=1 Tax=Amphora coffeiformis TaxID=265554 RepID=A0A6S8P7Y9_9STRA
MRLDEDSFLHSPIDYNIFEFMESQRYVYGYRMCSYEMQTAYRMWRRYQKFKGPEDVPKRDLALRGCGFYNNFFVADLEFFRQDDVQDFLQFIYQRGHIYVWRLGDLVIHTMTIYKFAQSFQVHRFLDFTYEHGTIDNTTGCLMWGGMQAGYRDVEAAKRLDKYHRERSKDGACVLNQTILTLEDLSPTYAHLPSDIKSVALQTVVAGNVEVIGKGNLSG